MFAAIFWGAYVELRFRPHFYRYLFLEFIARIAFHVRPPVFRGRLTRDESCLSFTLLLYFSIRSTIYPTLHSSG
jgi:hypothetical protein